MVNGELIAGGPQVHLVSGASADQVSVTPEPAGFFLVANGLSSAIHFSRIQKLARSENRRAPGIK